MGRNIKISAIIAIVIGFVPAIISPVINTEANRNYIKQHLTHLHPGVRAQFATVNVALGWLGIYVELDELRLRAPQNQVLVQSPKLEIQLPWISLFGESPSVNLNFKRADVLLQDDMLSQINAIEALTQNVSVDRKREDSEQPESWFEAAIQNVINNGGFRASLPSASLQKDDKTVGKATLDFSADCQRQDAISLRMDLELADLTVTNFSTKIPCTREQTEPAELQFRLTSPKYLDESSLNVIAKLSLEPNRHVIKCKDCKLDQTPVSIILEIGRKKPHFFHLTFDKNERPKKIFFSLKLNSTLNSSQLSSTVAFEETELEDLHFSRIDALKQGFERSTLPYRLQVTFKDTNTAALKRFSGQKRYENDKKSNQISKTLIKGSHYFLDHEFKTTGDRQVLQIKAQNFPVTSSFLASYERYLPFTRGRIDLNFQRSSAGETQTTGQGTLRVMNAQFKNMKNSELSGKEFSMFFTAINQLGEDISWRAVHAKKASQGELVKISEKVPL